MDEGTSRLILKTFKCLELEGGLQKILFLHNQGVTHKELVPEGRAANSEFYVQTVERFTEADFESEATILVSWFFLHDNGPAHCAMTEEHFLANHSVVKKATHFINLTL